MKKLAWVLVIIGALNWGLVGLGWLIGGKDWNVVHLILGSIPTLEAIIYLLVGIAAVASCMGCKGKCKACMNGRCEVHGKTNQGQM
ncbi:MAG: DUF378 domain-containing protein [Candidatus Paceibacterota bacterium]